MKQQTRDKKKYPTIAKDYKKAIDSFGINSKTIGLQLAYVDFLAFKQHDITNALSFLKTNGINTPEIGIVLGTGLGRIVDEITIEKEIAYSDIPHFPKATVEFHSGKLIYGILEGKKVLVMSGRFHLYEGYNLWEVTYGIRTLHGLGIQKLLVSNAAGAINLKYKKGDLPWAETIAKTTISLPVHEFISKNKLDIIIKIILENIR